MRHRTRRETALRLKMLHWGKQSEVEGNRGFFRTVNERLLRAGVLRAHGEDLRFFCECGSPECASRLDLGHDEFERLLEQCAGRVVAPGHEDADDEVLLEGEGYIVVSDSRF